MEAQLQSLKVVDLKKLLQDAALPQSGTKAELIKRLLENPNALSSLGGSSNAEEEDLLGETADAKATPKQSAPAAQAMTTQKPVATTTTSSISAPATESVVEEKDDETKKAEILAELEKRKARAIKFGMSVEEVDAKIQRIQRFGLQDDQVSSVKAIDGELRGGKKGKKDKIEKNGNGTSAENGQKSSNKNQKATAAPAPAPVIDPIEEEKKRKRAERFGVPSTSDSKEPSEKKIKA